MVEQTILSLALIVLFWPLQGQTVSNAEPCQWPTAVALDDGSCSGVLIHPQVVMTAGHCIGDGSGPAEVRFGETASAPVRVVATSSCARHPEADGGITKEDYAYCLLAEPVELAIVPPLMGCELDSLEVGAGLVTVGWGDNGSGLGIKRISTSEFLGWYEGMIGAASDLNEVCHGDSGGPTFVRLPDGSWRVVGISSGGPAGDIPDCIDPVLIVPAGEAIAWIEAQTGIDISPCHLADGTWAPSSACTGFALDPNPVTGAHPWVDGSCADPRSGPISTCGPSFEQSEESEAPIVDIVMPADGAQLPSVPAQIDVVVDAHDGEGVAVLAVELLVDDEVVASESVANPLDQPPIWMFADLEFTEGTHQLRATATDYWGNVGSSDPLTIIVGGASDDATDEPAGESGCACSAGADERGMFGLLGLIIGAAASCRRALSSTTGHPARVPSACRRASFGRRRRR